MASIVHKDNLVLVAHAQEDPGEALMERFNVLRFVEDRDHNGKDRLLIYRGRRPKEVRFSDR